jgi:hypothetical protein
MYLAFPWFFNALSSPSAFTYGCVAGFEMTSSLVLKPLTNFFLASRPGSTSLKLDSPSWLASESNERLLEDPRFVQQQQTALYDCFLTGRDPSRYGRLDGHGSKFYMLTMILMFSLPAAADIELHPLTYQRMRQGLVNPPFVIIRSSEVAAEG